MTKEKLFELIKNDNLFWSYNVASADDISDELLIEHILIYSDVDVIKALFTVYDDERIKSVWEQRIVPDMRYKRLNVYLGRIFFNIEEIGAFIDEKNAAHSRYEKLKRSTSPFQQTGGNGSVNRNLCAGMSALHPLTS